MSVRTAPTRDDDFQTPVEAWELLDKHLTLAHSNVWCPFWLEGDITWEHKDILHSKEDFFKYEPDKWSYIVDNPPYSIKEKVLKRCFERKYFRKMIEGQRFTIIIPKDRYNFNGGNNKKHCSFKSCWFCVHWKGLEEGIIWE